MSRGVEFALAGMMFLGSACGYPGNQPGAENNPVITSTQTTDKNLNSEFENTDCGNIPVTIPKPKGWTMLEPPPGRIFIDCYFSKTQITSETQFRRGLKVSMLTGTVDSDKERQARRLASSSDAGALAIANTFQETRVGSYKIFSGSFTNTANRVLSDEKRKIIVEDGSNVIYILSFISPKPFSAEDFKNYGDKMLADALLKGKPTR